MLLIHHPLLAVFVFATTMQTIAEDGRTRWLPERGVSAHRGASTTHPENTLAALREALRLGAHQIEFDVAMSRDEKLVLLHDDTVDRTTNGRGKVVDLTLKQLKELDAGAWKGARFAGERIPTLDEALALMPQNIWLNIHLKGGEKLARRVTQRLVVHDRLHQSFLACSAPAARAAKETSAAVKICNMERQANSTAYVDQTIAAGSDFIQLLGGQSVSREHVEKLKAHGVRINYCCTNDENQLSDLLAVGVEFPLVDDLATMLSVAEAAGVPRLVPRYRGSGDGKDVPTLRFSEHLIAGGYAYPYGIGVADFDGDGDLDITSADYQPHNHLYLYENRGGGTFRRRFVQRNDGRRLERHMNGDVDGDGDPDVVIVKNLYGHLLWFENGGAPMNEDSWSRHVITTDLPGAYNVDLADFDSDGDLDVVASSWVLGNQFSWFENDGTPASGEWRKFIIEADLQETRGVRVADFDGDGDFDVYGTAPGAGEVNWYENPGDPSERSWAKHVVDRAPRPMHGDPIDVDGDGDIDIVQALGMAWPRIDPESHHIVWYENVAPGSTDSPDSRTWVRHVIADDFPDAFEAVADDLDGDGDVDVAATSWRQPGCVAWFENQGEDSWRRHNLKNNWRSANNLLIADLDGDGRRDILAAAEHTSYELRWWRNEGHAPPGPFNLTRVAQRVLRTVSHQGAKGVAPANTLAAIRAGLAAGATTIEVDVRSSKDGVPVLRHDATLDASTDGTGPVRDKTLAELKLLDAGSWFDPRFADERVPTLREALELCRGDVEILLDLKESSAEFHAAVAAAVRAYGEMGRTTLGVRSVEQARFFRQAIGTSRQLGLIPDASDIEAFAAAGVQSIRLKKSWLKDADIVARHRKSKLDLLISSMTGSRREVLAALAFEPDAIVSDHPARLLASLRKLRGDLAPPDSVAAPRSPVDLRAARRRAAHRRRRIIMNNDGNDCRSPEAGEPRTREHFLSKRTAPLIDSHVDAIFYCTGVFGFYKHESRLTELRKHGTRHEEDWAWELGIHGADVLASVIGFAHAHEKELFWSMRMNDTHDSKYDAAMSEWKRSHPELLVGKKGESFEYGRCRWQGRWSSLDYERPEVRERAFLILRDVATRYDVDGLELDFFRHPIYFKPQMFGEPVTQRHCDIMTRFLRRVRGMTEAESARRGRPLLIAVRLPDSIGYAKAIGLDLVRWLEDDLVDIVTGGGYFHLEPWDNLATLGKTYDVPVYACLSASRLGFPAAGADRFNRRRVVGREVWRGEALRAWDSGVSGIYIFNLFDPHDAVFGELGDPDLLRTLGHRYQPQPGRIDHWLKGGEQFIRLPMADD